MLIAILIIFIEHGNDLPTSVYAIEKNLSIAEIRMDQMTFVVECAVECG